ncbi:unnamed protein product, partial [Ceratitis capitata]
FENKTSNCENDDDLNPDWILNPEDRHPQHMKIWKIQSTPRRKCNAQMLKKRD